MSKPTDYDALRRAIDGGVAEAARDAGLRYVVLDVKVGPMPGDGAMIQVTLAGLTPEQVEGVTAGLRDLQEKTN